MNTESLKWKKHLLLVEYCLRDYEDLISEIHRFDKAEVEKLLFELTAELNNDKLQNRNAFYVIKFVKRDRFYKLPNFRVYHRDDLLTFQSIIALKKYQYDELWYCKTVYDNTNIETSVAGRISFERELYGNSQIIEQLWNRSPRLIEDYNNSADYIYTRASRNFWGHRYNIEKIHIPPSSNVNISDIKLQFATSVIAIEREREKIEIFEEYLSGFQYCSFSLEYKIINGRLFIIDWDTPDDMLVLRRR